MENKKRVLVTGSNGQLGKELQFWASNYPEIDFTFTDVEELNITKNDAIENFVKQHNFDFIINCAAYTAVDKAETDKDNAFLINTIAVDFLVDAAQSIGATLIHISTDYVFDGESNKPYQEESRTFPQSTYGETKHEGEKLILFSAVDAMIIRTSWLYSTYGNNFVKTMLRLGGEKDEINVIFDQVGTPTYARDLGKAIIDIITKYNKDKKESKREIYHYTNEGVASWFDFASEIFRQKQINCKVNAVDSSAFPTPAKRPHYSVLNKGKIKADYNIEIPHWVDSLKQMLTDIE